MSGIGFHFLVTVGFCIFLGRKADEYFASAPTGTLIGILLGTVTAIYTAYREIKKVNDA